MNNTRFALIEFSMTTPWKEIHTRLVMSLCLAIHQLLLISNAIMRLNLMKERVKELINMGCYTQINSSHVLKPKLFGDKYRQFKKRARYFLEKKKSCSLCRKRYA